MHLDNTTLYSKNKQKYCSTLYIIVYCSIQGDTSVNTNDDRVEDTNGDTADWNIDEEFPNQLTDTSLMGDDAAVKVFMNNTCTLVSICLAQKFIINRNVFKEQNHS